MMAKLGLVLQESLARSFASSAQSMQNLSEFLSKFLKRNLLGFFLLFLTLVSEAPVLFIFKNHETFYSIKKVILNVIFSQVETVRLEISVSTVNM
jgi:hypothetical protein